MSSSKAFQISQKFIQLGGVRWSHAFPGATASAGASTRSGKKFCDTYLSEREKLKNFNF
jgi:hypothetical protein